MKRGFKAWVKRTKKSNAAFELMSKAEKRVQIAQDVIARINFEQFKPDTGCLIGRQTKRRLMNTSESLKRIANEGTTSCTVCAKGGLFMSYVGRVNEFNTREIRDNRNNHLHDSAEMRKLQEIFSSKQLALIEFVLEGRLIIEEFDFSDRNRTRARNFYLKYNTSTERLIAICQNIIRNNGTFKL